MSISLNEALEVGGGGDEGGEQRDGRGYMHTPKEKQMDEGAERVSERGKTRFDMYIAINEYSKRMEDELDMKPGDKIEAITDDQEYNDGWYYGRNLRTGEEGLYPKLFTQVISIGRSTPNIMRAKSTKRVHSPLSSGEGAGGYAGVPKKDSGSELPTPQTLETAATIRFPPKISVNGGEARVISVKSTMSDIDKALEELRGESMSTAHFSDEASELSKIPTSGNTTINNYVNSSSPSSNDITTINNTGTSNGLELNPADAAYWNPEQVTAYLTSTGFDKVSATKFQEHKISGAILLELELTHLKELDISSFGTRFEIFKEIEAIKEIVAKNQTHSNRRMTEKARKGAAKLMPAVPVSQESAGEIVGRREKSHVEEKNKSGKVTPILPKTSTTPKIPASVVFSLEDTPLDETFMSPRKAPIPPSYPSPVQPPLSPAVSRIKFSPSTSSFQQQQRNPHPVIYEQAPYPVNSPVAHNSKARRNPGQQTQELQSSVSPPSNTELPNPYVTVSPQNQNAENMAMNNELAQAIVKHRKNKSGGSFVELFNRISMLSSPTDYEIFGVPDSLAVPPPQPGRPTSSIYAHSRNTSGTNHTRSSILDEKDSGSKQHRRNSLMLGYLTRDRDALSPVQPEISKNNSLSSLRVDTNRSGSQFASTTSLVLQKSPAPLRRPSLYSPLRPSATDLASEPLPNNDERRRSVSAREHISPTAAQDVRDELSSNNSLSTDKSGSKNSKRSVSDAVKAKRRLNSNKVVSKKQTSAFTEGIRAITVSDATRDAECSGWMSKKGAGTMGVWKNRFFVLHGTRLSYFANANDNRERGLIDITSHRVLPAKEDDKFVALYAASVGKGRYCFKLVPPAPGSKKGLTFTQPRVHYFAVETREEMRTWMAALMKATIDIDNTVPVISSCATPTVSLSRAQEMFAQALEETYKRDEKMLNQEDSEELYWDQHHKQEGDDTLNGTASTSSLQNNSASNVLATPGLPSPFAGIDSPTGSSGTTKHSQQCGFSFENPSAGNSHGPEYFGLDPKYMGDKI
ncbi:uncharacterized protein Ecym_7141 [Eremothecium cymbalariae DBVPG|uniref:Protein BOI2 n=1 Tax=Eremothecium cymbalariae (strain CBS 270.75 / DBVPG 7215 / KCTC 17166 / NRRL Y-17582) TaxID=931890 RepID=G8JVX5_ERECY|nr:hypothetical protein Ecym_7141 [Eremothecium cymbalariae DBVPG\